MNNNNYMRKRQRTGDNNNASNNSSSSSSSASSSSLSNEAIQEQYRHGRKKVFVYLQQCGGLRHYELKKDKKTGHINTKFMIGKGTYGQVFFVKDIRPNTDSKYKYCALKKIFFHNSNDGFPKSSIREISLLRKIDHPSIVKLLDVVVGKKKQDGVYLAFEYCPNDLGRILKTHGKVSPFKPPHIKRIMLSLCEGIEYLHRHFIMHRDLKATNILYTTNGEVKIADFGMARVYTKPHGKYTPKVVTMWYRSPEVLLGTKEYDEKCDIWSLGCMFGELIKGDGIIKGEKELDQMIKLIKFIGKPSTDDLNEVKDYPNTKMLENQLKKKDFGGSSSTGSSIINGIEVFRNENKLTDETTKLLKAMLSFSGTNRISAKECLKHPYFLTEGPKPSRPNMMPKWNDKKLQAKFDEGR